VREREKQGKRVCAVRFMEGSERGGTHTGKRAVPLNQPPTLFVGAIITAFNAHFTVHPINFIFNFHQNSSKNNNNNKCSKNK